MWVGVGEGEAWTVPRSKAKTIPHPRPAFAFLVPQCRPTPHPLMALPAQASFGLHIHVPSRSALLVQGPLPALGLCPLV